MRDFGYFRANSMHQEAVSLLAPRILNFILGNELRVIQIQHTKFTFGHHFIPIGFSLRRLFHKHRQFLAAMDEWHRLTIGIALTLI